MTTIKGCQVQKIKRSKSHIENKCGLFTMEDERVSWIMHNSYIHTIVNWMRNTLYNAYYTIVEISSHTPLQNCLKNGYYIPAIHAALYYVTGDAVISTAVAMKMYPANYFYWFGEQYDFRIPKRYNWIKQFTRFTDTGHFVSFLYYFW